jgi:hypothetical protein
MKAIHTIKLRFILITVIFGAAVFATAGEDKFTRTIKKDFQINSDANLIIDNKYGKIHCANWEKNSISIEVTITVDAPNEQKAARVFDMIDIQIDGSSSEVSAETDIDDDFSGNNDNLSLQIDYMVFMPETISVELDNKFGEIYLENVKGPALIDLSYGSLKAKNLSNAHNELDIKFSKATFEQVYEGYAEIKYSDLIVFDSRRMDIESKFSTIRFERLGFAVIESQYDSFTIGDIQNVEIDAGFTELKISKLIKRAVIESEYGGIQVKYVAPGFEEVTIYNEFGDVELGVDEEATFSIDATVKFGSLDYPKENASISKETEGYTTTHYFGKFGSDPKSGSKVFIESSNAGVTIKSW